MSFLNRNSSSSQANQSTTTKNTSQNTNVQPSGAGTAAFGNTKVGGNFTVVNTTSDAATTANALKSNAALATHTVDAAKAFNTDSAALTKSLANTVADFVSKTNSAVISNESSNLRESLAFGENAFSTVDHALQSNSDTLSSALKSNASVLSGFQDTVSKLLNSTQDTNSHAFQTVAESQSANVGLIDTTQTFVKYGVYAIGIVALAVALYAASK